MIKTLFSKRRLLPVVVALALLLTAVIPAAAVWVGNDEVVFMQVLYDYPNPGESTWYYRVTSGAQPSISHVIWQLNLTCLRLVDGGEWDGVDPSTLSSSGEDIIVGYDPTTTVTGVKFDEGFEDGETRYYYFTVNGNYAIDNSVVIASKGGRLYDTATMEGPSLTCQSGANPAIDIEKHTNGEDADEPTGPEIIEGDPVTWEYIVTNYGNVALSNLSVTDDVLGAICGVSTLGAGESFTCSVAGTATVGQYANLGTVTGWYGQQEVSDSDPSHYLGTPRFIPNPLIDIEKYVNTEDADEPAGPEVLVGGNVMFDFVVTNVGNVALSDVAVTDDFFGAICSVGALGVGDSFTCSLTITAVEGQHVNTATATGWYNGQSTEDSDMGHYLGKPPFIPKPKLDFEKWVNGADADKAPGIYVTPGSLVTFEYRVTNVGNVTLDNILVADNVLGIICWVATLAPGETVTCTATSTAITGQYMNIGKAGAWYGGGPKTGGILVQDIDYAYYFGR
jgi:hypothetical protein